ASAFGQSTNYTALIAGQDTDGNLLVAGPVPNPWRFRTVGINPQILSTNPANAATGVATTANVVVAFSEPMNTTTVTLTSSPVLAFTFTWSNGNRTLTASHTTPFADCTPYTIQVGGRDTTGDPLIAGPVPNPWTFTTGCLAPVITNTNPANAAVDIALGAPVFLNFSRSMNTPTVPANAATAVDPAAPIVVTFSRGMDTTTVTAGFVPGAGVNSAWTAGDTVLTLTPSPALQTCTQYTVTINGNSKEGKPLAAGPVPNPWSFTTTCFVSAPGGLTVSRVAPNIVRLSWTAAPSADSYNV